MEKPQTVYATNFKGYFQTSRPENHHTIKTAKERNVQLSYVVCNQVYKGESEFESVEGQEFYRRTRCLQGKNKMTRSSITSASTNFCDSSEKRQQQLNSLLQEKRQNRKTLTKSFHFTDFVSITQNSNENMKDEDETPNIDELGKTNNLLGPENKYQTLDHNQQTGSKRRIFKSLNDAARLHSSFNQSEKSSSLNYENSLLDQNSPYLNKVGRLDTFMTPRIKEGKRFEEIQKTYTIRINKDMSKSYNSPHEQNSSSIESEKDQIKRIRAELARRQQQLQQTKAKLLNTQDRVRLLELKDKETQKLIQNRANSVWKGNQQSLKNVYETRQIKDTIGQFGGSASALLYLTLFLVLLSKDVTQI